MKAALSLVLTMVLLAGCGTANNNASPSPRNQTNGQTNNTTAQSLNGNRGLATNNVDGWGPGITNRGTRLTIPKVMRVWIRRPLII